MLFKKPPTTNAEAVQAAEVRGSHPAAVFKAATLSSGKRWHFVALCLGPAWVTAVLEQVGDEGKDPVKEPLSSCCLLTTHRCRLHAPRWRWFLLTLLTYSSKMAAHNSSSTGFSKAATTGALCVLGKGLNVRGLPLTGRKPVTEASFLGWKRYNKQRGEIVPTRLFSEPWVQPREIPFPGQSGTHNTLKGSLYFCLNYDDKYQQQEECVTIDLCHMKVAERGVWSAFWTYSRDWSRSGARLFSWTSWTYQPPLPVFWDIPSACSFTVLQHKHREITWPWSLFTMPTLHSLNRSVKQCMLLGG